MTKIVIDFPSYYNLIDIMGTMEFLRPYLHPEVQVYLEENV